MKPRLFISAVSAELGHTRQLVANVLSRLGYDPVWQDIFGTEPGDLRQVLRDKIDDCDGLIQIVGRGYGAEPPTVDPEFGRVSYTQFEFLYARSKGGKFKTWLIFADDGCTRDRPLDQLDLPHDLAHPDPAGYQTERRALQEAWRQRWGKSTHLWHLAASDTELELKIERLKDEFAELRRQFRSWRRNVTRSLVAALLLLGVVAGGVWWAVFRLPAEVVKQIGARELEQIGEQLRKQIDDTYQRELDEVDSLPEWPKREEAKKAAAESRDERIRRTDELLNSITATIQSGDASPVFLELNRILREEGTQSALAFVATKQPSLLDQAASLKKQSEREQDRLQRKLRRILAPLLEAVQLHQTRREFAEALTRCQILLDQDPNWPEVLHEHVWVQIELGHRALRYETLSAAKAHFLSAHESAERLLKHDADHPVWQRDLSVSYNKLGDLQLQSGQVTEALGSYQKGLKIGQKLAAADPSDAQAQRDLSASYERLGNVQLRSGQVTEALGSYQKLLEISQRLEAANSSDIQARRDLSVSYEKLGNVQLQSGQVTEALGSYQKALEIRQKLLAADPSDAQAQRDLSVSYEKLGDVSLQAGQVEKARTFYFQELELAEKRRTLDPMNVEVQRFLTIVYHKLSNAQLESGLVTEALGSSQKALEISQKLATAHPSDTQAQRDLSVSYERLGNVQLRSEKMTEALESYQKLLEISQKLGAADPSDARAQRDLSVSYNKLGDVQRKSGQVTEALGSYQKGLEISQKLAAADPSDARAQRDRSISYDKLGNVQLESGLVTEALGSSQKGLEIRQKLAAADPSDAQAQFDLSVSHVKIATVQKEQKQYEQAIESYGRGLKLLQSMKEQKRLAPVNQKWIGIVEEAIQQCKHAATALGDWKTLFEQPADLLPVLLEMRGTQFVQEGRSGDAAQAVAKLRELGTATADQLYNAACVYSLCAAGIKAEKDELTAEQAAERQKHISHALETLREAIKAGYKDFTHMQKDPDLTVLRDLPEFKALVEKLKTGETGAKEAPGEQKP